MKLALIGEAPGDDEIAQFKATGTLTPFVGPAGRMLNTLLRAAGIDREDCFITNVFDFQLPDNDVTKICGSKAKGAPGLPPVRASKYILPEFSEASNRLFERLNTFGPTTIRVPLGATALWALTGYYNIGLRRGGWHEKERCLPTYHPAAILRQYTWFPLALSDLQKAKGLADGSLTPFNPPLIPRPTYEQVIEFCLQAKRSDEPISFDIETSPKFRAITCIGIGTKSLGFMCIPLADDRSPGNNYWPSVEQELEIIRAVKTTLECSGIPKIAHHSTYDLTWLHDILGISVAGPVYDTRIIHHALVAELPHSLGSIAHNYLVLPPWKALRRASKDHKED